MRAETGEQAGGAWNRGFERECHIWSNPDGERELWRKRNDSEVHQLAIETGKKGTTLLMRYWFITENT